VGKLLAIALTGVSALLLHRLRSLATACCAVVVLLPYLVGLGLSQGIQRDAEASIQHGADLYVTGSQFGRAAPVPLRAVPEIRALDGVAAVTPRIVGHITLGRDRKPVVLVGIPIENFPAAVHCVEGTLPKGSPLHELVVGSELSRRLGLHVGSVLPPFYRNDQGERLSQVVGIFDADVSLWQAHLVFTTFDSAAAIFNQRGLATDLMISCRPGYQAAVATALVQSISFSPPGADSGVRPSVTTREALQALLPRGLLHREGVFTLHFILAFVAAILVVLVTTGVGLSERRREVGILKATGWQTDELLLRSFVESFLLSLASACAALLLAYLWLRVFNGFWIAGLFLAEIDTAPGFRVPFRMLPVPVLLAFVIAFAVVLSGTLYSTWRAATTPPREAMR
jgi:ABC-type lipoprotein release transport system permease subunit